MSYSQLDIQSKKKITVTVMICLAVALALCLIILIAVGIYNKFSPTVSFSGGLPKDKLTTTTVSKEKSVYGDLILVNTTHAYQAFDLVEDDLVKVSDYARNNSGKEYLISFPETTYLHKNAVAQAHAMLNKMCVELGNTYEMKSAYRSFEDQAGKEIEQGYSDHHTGLCFSLKREGSIDLSPEDETWLKENAHNYGFIQRYPEGKEATTGVSKYTYCFRYVGIAHATVMKEKNLCLEEYIQYLKKNATDKTVVDVKCSNGDQYYIYYYEFSGKQINIDVPKDPSKYPYTVSGTNDGGIIVTIKAK